MTTKGDNPRFFLYSRKSSEDDRQASSIGDQLRELQQLIEREALQLVHPPFREEKSAKEPGRPVFSDMLRRIERGEADALLCWDIDRLYRNPVDEGRVRWLLQRGVIREIRTPFRTFYPQDAGLLMGVEGGRATDHIITLRKGVLRGFRGKLAKGQRPGVAPPGYLNNTAVEKGERNVIPDPDRFALIRRAWDLMLTRRYSVRQIQRLAAEDWGLRSRKTKKLGGRPYTLSGWYRIFTEPFYYGSFWWKTPGTETRELYEGTHEPMVTRREFDLVQDILGRKGKPAPIRHRFAFTGLIRCGECQAMVTAENKYQIICPGCKLKFSALNKDACPRCDLAIGRMETPTRLNYTYYHCTKRKVAHCSQRSLRDGELERQIDEILAGFHISEALEKLLIQALEEDGARHSEARIQMKRSLGARATRLRREISHINALILSPDTDWSLISQKEVGERKAQLQDELRQIEERLATQDSRATTSLELSRKTFVFATYARFWFSEGTSDQKRAILAALGSNLALKDQKLHVDLKKPLQIVAKLKNGPSSNIERFEPKNGRINKEESPNRSSEILTLRRGVNAVRTYWDTAKDRAPLPVLRS